ncbi:MAG: glutamate 5-kinase [Turneriella sp.]|nr:glutamate 5-kinase [Leptospiraceae bacterium]MCX7633021.1 glutamate 5-kinase [Turneriella sp.]
MQNNTLKQRLSKVTHVVLKFGTGVLTHHIEQNRSRYFRSIARECRLLQEQGKKVVIVTSGAVGFGRIILSRMRSLSLPQATVGEKQALASLGQSLLIDTYRNNFAREKLAAAQILVTRIDFTNRQHRQNLKATLNQLFAWGAVPVINENDAVANEEIKFGDNDNLSADVALLFPHTLLILLTTVDGFYRNGEKVPHIDRITQELRRHAGDAGNGGTGGMITKLQAAEKMLKAGQTMAIASGQDIRVIRRLLAGENAGTWFYR